MPTVLVLFLCPRWLWAQQSTPLEAERQKTEERLAGKIGPERLDVLIELISETSFKDPMQAMAWGTEALELLEQWDDAESRFRLLKEIPWAYYYLGDYETALRYAAQFEELARAEDDPGVLPKALRMRSMVQQAMGELIPALQGLQEALNLVQEGEADELGRVLVNMGSLYHELGNLEESLEYHFRAYQLFGELDRPLGEAIALANVGLMNGLLGRFEEAIEYLERSLEIFQESGGRRRSAMVLGVMGEMHRSAGDPESALQFHQRSLAAFEELGLGRETASVLGEIGRDHHAMGELEVAESFYRRSLDFWEEAEVPLSVAEMSVALGRLERERGGFEAALEPLERAVVLYAESGGKRSDVEAYEEALYELAEVYRALGRDRRALETFRQHQDLKLARLEEERSLNLAEMQIRFDVDLKEQEIDFLQKGRRTLIAVFGLALLVLVLVFNRSRLKSREAMMHQAVEQEREVSAQLREIDKLKDEFLANTSHELRTPLYGITGLAESMRDGATGELSAVARANLDMIVASGNRLGHLVNDILDFSKLRHKSLELERGAVELHALVDVVLALSEPLLGSKDLRLESLVSTDLPFAEADPNRLQQILYNLVGNAIKFTETGVVEVSAAVEEDHLSVTVRDTGLGIPEGRQAAIFDAFEQADASVEREFGGTGLGLAVTRQLVELHGGRISVESTVDQGSKFSFTLPIASESTAVARAPATIAESFAELPPPVLEGTFESPVAVDAARILVVDDEPINRQVLQNYLALEQFDLVTASSGGEALRLMEEQAEQAFDLVLLDVMMPKMSGFEVCRKLRRHYSLEQLPILFLTAKNQVVDVVNGLSQGANDYLTKPISRDELLARIRPHVGLLTIHRHLEDLVAEKLSKIKVLEGLLPICARCKMIRDEGGEWHSLEVFIDNHSEAHFSHGICPACAREYHDEKLQPV